MNPVAKSSVAPGATRRLLCDEMLAGLARWLRAAGHDVALMAPGSADARVAAAARRDGRVLLTRDRDFASPSAAGLAAGLDVVSLGSDGVDRQAAELSRRLGLDWLAAPFTRCLVDGAALEPASERDVEEEVPEAARAQGGPFHRCPECGRVFWPGSHVRRMRARLEGFAAAPPPAGRPDRSCTDA